MRILIVAATEGEIARLAAAVDAVPTAAGASSGTWRGRRLDVLVTGVGMVATAARCSSALARQPYDLALNLGVCGSFDPAFAPGAVVHVVSDCLPELGAEDGDAFLTAQDLQLVGPDEFPFTGGRLVNRQPPSLEALCALPAVAAVTVNTVHGRESSIAALVDRCRPAVESMEGAAFMYSCLLAAVPFAQVRAVSNRVERRNRRAWNLPGAIENLAASALTILEQT